MKKLVKQYLVAKKHPGLCFSATKPDLEILADECLKSMVSIWTQFHPTHGKRKSELRELKILGLNNSTNRTRWKQTGVTFLMTYHLSRFYKKKTLKVEFEVPVVFPKYVYPYKSNSKDFNVKQVGAYRLKLMSRIHKAFMSALWADKQTPVITEGSHHFVSSQIETDNKLIPYKYFKYRGKRKRFSLVENYYGLTGTPIEDGWMFPESPANTVKQSGKSTWQLSAMHKSKAGIISIKQVDVITLEKLFSKKTQKQFNRILPEVNIP